MSSRGIAANGNAIRWAQGLGWFSIGLGLAEVLAPGGLARLTGVPPRRGLLRLLGLREIASGIAILSLRKPGNALWSRVGGDAVDMGLLTTALLSRESRPSRVATTMAAVAGVTALDIVCSQRVSRSPGAKHGAVHVETSVTINRPAEELYAFWRQFENLPRFMNHLESIQVKGDRHSHWAAKGPAGATVEWDAEIIQEKPNELIAWRSLVGSQVDTAGSVRFERAPADRGTVVRVNLEYSPPGGVLGAAVAKLFGEAPEKQIPVDLRRFKQLMETGEILTTEGQPAGRPRSTSRKFDEYIRK